MSFFNRLDEITREKNDDFEVQMGVGKIKQHLVNRGAKLKELQQAVRTPAAQPTPAPPAAPAPPIDDPLRTIRISPADATVILPPQSTPTVRIPPPDPPKLAPPKPDPHRT